MFDTNITTREKNKRHPQSVVNLKFKNFCPLCFCLTKTFFLWPNKVTIFVPKSSNLFSPRKTVGTIYIYIYKTPSLCIHISVHIYIYIYTRSPSLDTLCPIRLSLKPCWLLPPRGFLHFHFFKFFKNQKFKSFRISVPQKKNMLQN